MLPHKHWMTLALAQAKLGWGATTPNPLVGAVLVSAQGQLLGQGYHARYGGPHAEVNAIAHAQQSFGKQATLGATLYVTLEPCHHTGKTPPCTQAILHAGIQRVIYGAADPNPKVCGQGGEFLRHQGLDVTTGVLKEQCQTLVAPYFWRTRHASPYLTLKLATTLDAKIATASGESQWITSPQARQWVHWQRAYYTDAILSTAATVIKDNAKLTARPNQPLPEGFRPPVRVILDRTLRLADPAASGKPYALFAQPLQAPILILTSKAQQTSDKKRAQLKQLEQSGVPSLFVDETPEGRLNLHQAMAELYAQKLYSIWAECGAKLAGTLLEANLINQLHWILVPKLFADPNALPAISHGPLARLSEATTFNFEQIERLGPDILLSTRLKALD
ncbi:MAG: bifunctional diaminohydroxyphosphoribosylaminopyrimidine deaminase/5-amino-6-(5-phosphoribosylamino)uracil reductase RibD [Vampirovibrionales bacterium]|nr:bifunctional diaminohydroxyphosphoribosylaminopyrimidine deaminase/5-amino-6-(5-phosphoribosylamino)uracil reductase RibD [Vampirovibrionales bacterium]